MKRAMLCAVFGALAAPSWAALPAPYAPAGKSWSGAMAAFFSSPAGMAEMPKSPLTDHLGGLSLKPAEFNLAIAPVVEQLEAFGLERFTALTEPAKAQALQDALPKAAKAVANRARELETAALALKTEEADMALAAEGLRQLHRSFGVFTAAGGFSAERLGRAHSQSSWRLGKMRGIRMDGEMRRLQEALLGQPAKAEIDEPVMELQEKALTRPLRRDEAVMELMTALREGSPRRQLAVLRALAAVSAAMTDEAKRVDLAAELSPVLADAKDARVLAAGHLLLGRLDPAHRPTPYPALALGGSRLKFGLRGFRTARLTTRPAKIPPYTDGGELYAFKVRKPTSGRGSLIGIGARAVLTRLARGIAFVAASAGVAAGSVALYAYDPLIADALAALVIISYLVIQRFKAGSRGDATADGRTPP